MDSFCSLFDPSDGQNKPIKKRHKADDTVKKKSDVPPKGRRRGRRASGKNETLPEESSFLCEPQLSTELLVKDVSYLENYIEINKRDDETRCDDKKPKRRNSGRRNRRKKKCSPPKDLQNSTQDFDIDKECDVNWNNQSEIQKISNDTVGKNVNDLRIKDHSEYKAVKRKDFHELDNNVYHRIIEKLEKVNLKDDTYLAGDFNTEVLDDDFVYSSDDMDDLDLITDQEDSSSEVYGSLPPEPRFGNVEYKLQLVSPCERRFQHLVTQLKWRLRSGGGAAVYVVGVRDCGALVGLPPKALRGSLRTLRRMAAALGAHLAHVTARRVCKLRAVAEVYLRMIADNNQSVELRVAVMGANEAGKSTLIGVLTQGELDNGRGSARLNMFRHLHEVKSGRTSSLSHEILGFDAQGNVVNYGCSELMTAERIGERSAKLVSFLDLAGHTKYQRTTLHGLTGYSPHYAMLVISATAGITRITEEHIGLLVALKLSFFTVITKCELAAGALPGLIARLEELLAPADKKPLLISDENAARNCVAPQKLILDSVDRGNHCQDSDDEKSSKTEVAVFPVSCVRGMGLNTLHAYLLALQPPTDQIEDNDANEPCEFQIDEIFHVDETAGPVVGGLLARGRVCEGDRLLVGPLDAGEFVDVTVRSVYRNRVQCGVARAGRSASLGLDRAPLGLRAGMVLLTAPPPGRGGPRPTFGGCGGACAERVSKLIKSGNDRKNKRNVRRKNKNLLQDIANVENSLTKECILENNNTYKSESDVEHDKDTSSDSEVCVCVCKDEEIPLEDPNDPRGCIFFQASVHVLRHATTIYPGFQCTVHVGNVRQTSIIEGIMSHNNSLSAGGRASVVFRFTRCPEYLVVGRTLLFTAGLGTRAIGQITQIFPYVP